MSRMRSITLSILLSAMVVQDAAAQWNVARFEAGRSRAYATFGLDPAFVGSLGLARVGTLLDHEVQVSGEVGVAAARMDARDFRLRLGIQTLLARWRSVTLTGSATAIARGTDNDVYEGYNFGADLTGALGVYRPRWFVAGEFGKDKAVITHVTHSEWYRTYYYPEARDGWYLDAGGTYHYGAAGGFALRRAELTARAGWHRTERFNDLVSPVYASVGVGFEF